MLTFLAVLTANHPDCVQGALPSLRWASVPACMVGHLGWGLAEGFPGVKVVCGSLDSLTGECLWVDALAWTQGSQPQTAEPGLG